jgi:hypothetical protein
MIMTEVSGFAKQVIMYSKGLYGKSEYGVIADLMNLLNAYCGYHQATVSDVRHYIVDTFNTYADEKHRYKALMDAFNWGWTKNFNMGVRTPEECMLSALYDLDGSYVELWARLSGVFFGSEEEKKRVDELVEQWRQSVDIPI